MAKKSITEQFTDRLTQEFEVGDFRGFKLKLRRMRSRAIYARGEVPMIFADAYRRAVHPDFNEPAPPVTEKDTDDYKVFQMQVVIDSCIEPKLKLNPDDPGDILLDVVPDDVVEFIWRYATRTANFRKAGEALVELKEEVTAE